MCSLSAAGRLDCARRKSASARGAKVILCDAQRSAGRKFLIAGRGGLNLTHSEAVETFPERYRAQPQRWKDLLGEFGPADLRAWSASLGFETYVGSSGRVFPRGQKSGGLLRAWLRRLRQSGVELQMGLRLNGLRRVEDGWRAKFEGQAKSLGSRTIILALGGASYPETGSNGTWPTILSKHKVRMTSWQPANCGWEVDWPNEFKKRVEGLPLKNITVRAGDERVSGELLITRYGIEGGAIYRLGPELRAMAQPQIEIDLKPQLSIETVRQRLANGSLKLSGAASALLDCFSADGVEPALRLKYFALPLRAPRPIAEAISSAGGISWDELDKNLMLKKMPGVFAAGRND